MNTVSKYSGVLCCAIAALCATIPASAQTLALKLNGYLPNSYGTCRNNIGLGSGNACTTSATCPLGETCRNRFIDVDCVTTADCTAAIGAGSTCVETLIVPGDPPLTRMRCSPMANVPQGVVGPARQIFVEAYIEDWDLDVEMGQCSYDSNFCDMNDPQPCKSCREFSKPPGAEACQADDECTSPDTCRLDQHCNNNPALRCENNAPCLGGACVPRACLAWPRIASYQWTIDASTFRNGRGPNSVLSRADIACTVADEGDTCEHGNASNCTCNGPFCVEGTCDNESIAYIEGFRGDFIFSENGGFSPIKSCSLSGLDPTCISVSGAQPIGVVDDGRPRYLGSLVLDVPGPISACGTYEIGFTVGPASTFLRHPTGVNLTNVPIVSYEPLTLTITADPVCDPPDCNDGNPCTVDECTCNPITRCANTPVVCPDGQVCNPANGQCVAGVSGACCNGDVCTVVSAVNCTGDYQGDDTTCDPNPCVGQANVVSWESVATHGAVVGEVGLIMPENGTYTEPRSTGVRKIIVTYDGPVTAAGSEAGIPAACDVNDLPVTVEGINLTTAQGADNEVIINFSAALPGSGLTPGTHTPARYRVELSGVGGAAADTSREFSVVLGDAFGSPIGTGDARVNAQDNGFVRSLAAQGINPIDPNIAGQVRSDVFTNGAINAQDNGLVRSLAAEGLDGRGMTLDCQ